MPRHRNHNYLQKFSRLITLFLQGLVAVFYSMTRRSPASPLAKLRQRKIKVTKLGRSIFMAIVTCILTVSLSSLNLWFPQPAYAAGLYIEPITWDFIGLDSNNVNVGPNNFLLAARVCNTSGATLNNISVQYVRTGAYNPYITVTAINGINIDTLNITSLPSGPVPQNHQKIADAGTGNMTPANCFDGYFNAVVTRDSAAYNTVQQYKIVASAAGVGSVDTNTALGNGTISGYNYGQTVRQQLYVEKILSQARNEVISFVGPSNVFVGDTVEYVLTTKTATAYPQLTVSSDFPNGILQLVDVKTTYTSDPGAVSSGVYYDGCGWLANPSDPGYNTSANTCEGPVVNQDTTGDGKVGNTVVTRYRVKVLSTGNGASSNTINVKHLINDFSGGSFHYNADYGFGLGISTITVNDSTTDLQIVKSHTGNFATGNNTYQLQVTNNGPLAARGTLTVIDTLPAGFSYVSATGTNWTCSASGQVVTCTNPNTSNLAVNATSTIALTVNVSASAASYSLNTATVTSGSPDSNLANNSSSDPTTVLSGANIELTKAHSPATFVVGSTGTYTLTASNPSAFDSNGPVVITDTLPAGITYISGSGTVLNSQNWTCSANGQNVTCTNPASLLAGQSSTVTLNVAIAANAVPSVLNTATVTTSSFDPVLANNTATDTAPAALPIPDLSIAKSHTGNFIQGGTNAYTITITNVGTQPTTGAIDVVDTFPAGAGMTYQGVSGTNWSCKTNCTVGNTGPVTFTNAGPLAAGATTSFVVTVIAPTVGTFNIPGNQVDVTTPGDTTAGGNNRATDPTTVVATPSNPSSADVIVSKTITTSPTPANSRQIVYTIDVGAGSAGTTATIPTNFTDIIPSQITFNRLTGITCTVVNGNDNQSACGTLSGTGQTINYATMALKKSTNPAIRIVVTGTLNPGITGTISNTATVQPTGGLTDVNPSDNSSTVTFEYNESDLIIAKTPPAANVTQGGKANYTITVTNNGTGSTSGTITVTDTLNANLTFVQGVSAAGSSGWTCSALGQVVTCKNPGPLAAGASSSISLQATVSGSATLNTVIPNTASVSTPGEITTSNNTSAIANVTPIAPNSDLIISKSGPATTSSGQTLSYSLTVTNQGTTSAVASTNPITVTDTLQSGLTFLSGSGSGWTCNASGQVVTCTSNTDLAPSATSVITINTLVGTSTVSPINNNSSIALTGETVTNNNTSNTVVTTINQSADLAVVKSHTDNFVQGQNASYKLLVTNYGPSSIPNLTTVTVTDTLPNNLAFVSSTGGGFTCTAPAKVNGTPQVVTCTSTTGLVVGTSATITLNVTVGATTPLGTITNTASVSSPISDPVSGNNSSNDPTTIQALQADLRLTKRTLTSFAINGKGTYSLEVENLGPAIATGSLTITDNLPANLTLASFIGEGWTCSVIGSSNISCTNPNTSGLASGSTTAVNITVNIGAGTPVDSNSITNTANLNVPAYDPVPANNTANAPTTINGSADLSVTKTTSSTFIVGQQATYTIQVLNSNSSSVAAASPITITDQLPNGLTYVSGSGSNWTCPTAPPDPGPDVECTYSQSIGIGSNSSELTLVVSVNASTVSPFTNFVTAISPTPDPNPDNNTAQIQSSLTTPATMDYGDAPDTGIGTGLGNYKTTSADGGASQVVSNNLRLGSLIDIDNGSLQNVNADADDTTGTDDEDAFPNGLPVFNKHTANTTHRILVPVNNTTGGNAFLVGYLDLNQDGDFDDANEKTATVTVANNATTATLDFTVPAGANLGDSYLRLRFSANQTEAESSVGAGSAIGEIEDYKVTIQTYAPPQACPAGTSSKTFAWGSQGTGNFYAHSGNGVPASQIFNIADTDVKVNLSFAGNNSLLTNQSSLIYPSGTQNSILTGTELFDGGRSPAQSSLQMNISGARNDKTTAIISFTRNGSPYAINSVSYSAFDVDNNGSNWQDRVAVRGVNNATSIIPTLKARPNLGGTHVLYVPLNPNVNELNVVATGGQTSNSGVNGDTGSVDVSFASPITQFQIDYYNGPNANNPSGAHGIGLIGSIQVCVPPVSTTPNLLLVKRITAINGDTTGFQTVVPGDGADNTKWPSGFVLGATSADAAPGDTVDYTIYFLNTGDGPASTVKICDPLSEYLTYIPNTYGSDPDLGIRLEFAGSTSDLTGTDDGDRGQFVGAGIAPTGCVRPDNPTLPITAADNQNGTVTVSLSSVNHAVSAGNPNTSYGYVRFRAIVK